MCVVIRGARLLKLGFIYCYGNILYYHSVRPYTNIGWQLLVKEYEDEFEKLVRIYF